MAQYCAICGRGPRTSISRSHSNIATKRRQHLNLQTIRISDKKIRVCTKCLKSLKKRLSPLKLGI